jgi:predicted permease
MPGVVAAGLVNRLPLADPAQTGPNEIEGVDPNATSFTNLDYVSATPDYFRALEIPILAGRAFTADDREDAPLVAILDERFVKTAMAGANLIGRRVRIGPRNQRWMTVVGVAGHVRQHGLREEAMPQIYMPYTQRTLDRVALVVRTRIDAAAMGGSRAAAIREVDPEQPVYDARTLEAVVDRSVAQNWLQAALLASFAAIALVLASIGVYGVIAYTVGQRRREFGIRLALGARRAEIVAVVMRRGAWLFACGAAMGLVAAAASARVLSSLVYRVSGFDLVSVAFSVLALAGVALVACGVPARRAAGIDPSAALRAE